ncbi:SseB family protein [Micromonospora sp. CPCC 205556]|uniref:SseB family protein n=1 Tax=Micromonospora sp. CPCC 205556 TaxID=3122398 RepID=UPI002FEF7576
MTDWEPATEAEVALRDALRANDQELYFRVLARTELFLPVSAQALAGEVPMGWGTWTTGGRTHVLAFTSLAALHACLGATAGPSRRSPFADLAAAWPNHEWWLAVNPGLPVEGYLPAWFVSQLSRGDVRLPGRTLGARARLERAESLARARADGGSGREPTAGRSDTADRTASGGVPRTAAPSTAVGDPPGGSAPPTAPPRVPVAPHPTDVPAPRSSDVDAGRPAGAGGPTGGDPVDAGQPAGTDVVVDGRPPRDGVPASGRPAAAPTEPAWLGASRRRHLGGLGQPASTGADATGTNGRTSFFEPASTRAAAARAVRDNPLRSGDRAVPPRPGLGGQPFPRRRPATAPGDEATRAFRVDTADEQATQPIPAPEPPVAARRPDPLAEEPTRAFRVAPPGVEATQALPRRQPTPAEEPTQPLPDPAGWSAPPPGPDVTEELPPSIAEPVSGPPAPRRGFTPIVIEGTVIESRDLPASSAATVGDGPVPGGGTATRNGPAGGGIFAESPPIAPASPAPTSSAPVSPAPAPSAPASPAPAPVFPAPVSPAFVSPAPVSPAPEAEPAAPAEAEPSAAPTSQGVAGTPTGPTGTAAELLAFQPANDVEENLLNAAGAGSTDTFLSTLLLARVLLPVAPDSAPGSRPGDPGFVWRTDQLDGEKYVVVHTSPERLADHGGEPVETVEVRFVQLIRRWPDPAWSFAVNPGSPIGAKLPGEQIVGLANWAAEVGLGDDADVEPEATAAEQPVERPRYAPPVTDPTRPVAMQKAVAPSQLAYYLERGYDRVSGFVHRANELAHLNTPAQLHDALGLGYPGSPFARDADRIYVLRWPAYRPSLYRIPYGGQNEAAMRAMEGWVIERAPFRGNGFAPGESSDVVAEFKVDSARLPHGAQLWRIGADGTERVIAILDTDALLWRQVGEP